MLGSGRSLPAFDSPARFGQFRAVLHNLDQNRRRVLTIELRSVAMVLEST